MNSTTQREARPRRLGDAPWALLFIGPMLVGLLVFYIYPIFRSIWTSFTETGVFGGETWTGLTNYQEVVTSDVVQRALLNTLVYAGIVMLSVPIGLVIAVLLNTKKLRFLPLFRVFFFLPTVTMPVAVAWIWRLMFNGDFGTINSILDLFGIQGRSWLSDPHTALMSVSIVGVWVSIGYPIILFTAALQGVPAELEEAAQLDGAGPVRRFFSITIPLISPTIFFVFVLTLIGALQMFDLIFVMIGDASPVLRQTETIVYLFYQASFVQNNRGLGSAIAVCLMLIIMALTAIQFRLQRKWVHYE